VRLSGLTGQTQHKFFWTIGNDERAEHPIPEREYNAEIAIPVMRCLAMMDLMQRRAANNVIHGTAEGNPYMRMLQNSSETTHEDDCRRDTEYLEGRGRPREEVNERRDSQ
jgi:hypothetical protein